MGITSSSFPALTVLALEVFHLPLITTFWFNNRTHSGWSIALTYTYFWWLIRVGFDLGNPLLPLQSVDLFFESVRLYAGWFVLFSGLAALIGWIICVVMDIREPIPFYAILPSFVSYTIDTTDLTPCNQEEALNTVAQYDADSRPGLQRWNFDHIDPPYWHTLVGILLELFTVSVPAILFWTLFANNKIIAFSVPLGMKLLGYIAAGLYWSYCTDLYVWGPAEYNIKQRRRIAQNDDNSFYAFDPPMDKNNILFKRTQATIIRNVLIIGLIDMVLFLILAGILVFSASLPTLSLMVGVGLALVIFIGLVILVVTIIFWLRSPSVATTDDTVSYTRTPQCRIPSPDEEDLLDAKPRCAALNTKSRIKRIANNSGHMLLLTNK